MIIFEGFIESAYEIEKQQFWHQCNGSFRLKRVKQNTPKDNNHVVLTYLLIISLSMPVLPLSRKITVPLYPSSEKVLAPFIHSLSEWSRWVMRGCKKSDSGTTISPHRGSTERVNYYGERTYGRCTPSTNDWRGGCSREAQGLRRG